MAAVQFQKRTQAVALPAPCFGKEFFRIWPVRKRHGQRFLVLQVNRARTGSKAAKAKACLLPAVNSPAGSQARPLNVMTLFRGNCYSKNGPSQQNGLFKTNQG